MRNGSPSATAEMVCAWRALESALPPDQQILEDRVAGFFSSCGLAVLENLGLDELTGLYEKRRPGWLEAAPSLRLVIAEPASVKSQRNTVPR